MPVPMLVGMLDGDPTGAAAPDRGTGRRVAVVADDLTGAGDTVAVFAAAGWPAYLLLQDDADLGLSADGPVAVGRTLDSRMLGAGPAAASTAAGIVACREAGIERVYLKVDSTMRGSVRAQIRGALTAWRAEHPDAIAVVCPAYPGMGRTVAGGRLLVDGIPLPDAPAGSDPLSPMRTAVLTEIVPGSVPIPVGVSARALAGAIAAAGSDTVVVDAAREADLAALAAALDALGPRALPVGSAGLARHLARRWLPGYAVPRVGGSGEAFAPAAAEPVDGALLPAKVLVAVSSRNRVSLAQLENLLSARAGSASAHVVPHDLVRDLDALRGWGAERLAGDPAPIVTVRTDGERRARTGCAEAAYEIADALAAAVVGASAGGAFTGLVLVGGDGAGAILRDLGATALRITGSAVEGVAAGVVVGGAAAGRRALTKAGGFGDDETLTVVVAGLLGRLES